MQEETGCLTWHGEHSVYSYSKGGRKSIAQTEAVDRKTLRHPRCTDQYLESLPLREVRVSSVWWN